MKTKDLKNILGNEELSLEDKIAQIMALNGQDVNAAKDYSTARVQELENEVADLKAAKKELETKVESYKDYDDLVKFKNDTLSEKENGQKKDYLKKIGFKRPDLFFDKIDWSKSKYDEEKKEYVGLDVESLKSTYSDLFADPTPGRIKFGSVENGKTETSGANSSMNNFIRGIK